MAIKIAGTEVINDNKELVLAKLAEINTTIADTAVDVFVYDTSKDSDGGAWRKRTQGTSWYNETLNTSTRGSRKEFPAVAVIVAVGNTIKIYDGDDPDLPMWMVFELNGITNGASFANTGVGIFNYSSYPYTVTSISMRNGRLAFSISRTGGTLEYGMWDVNLISETSKIHLRYPTSAETQGVFQVSGNIAQRNSTDFIVGASKYGSSGIGGGIVGGNGNDVAMTVLPNAPIDAATGLPVPTIAVATDGGTSVIRDDGTVVDLTYTANVSKEAGGVWFPASGGIAWQSRYSSGGYVYTLVENEIPTADKSTASDALYANFGQENFVGNDLVTLGTSQPSEFVDGKIGSPNGLTHLDENRTLPANGMVAYTTSTYNTGWQNGEIKLATLSDTDDTDVTGSNLISGDAASDDTNSTGSWVNSGMAVLESSTTFTNGSTYALHFTANSNADNTYVSFSTVVGKTYTISFDAYATNYSGTSTLGTFVGTSGGGGQYSSTYATVSAASTWTPYSVTFTATSTTAYLSFYEGSTSNNIDAYIDNLSVRLAEEDRSVNGNGLQVFGSITKNPVATGADLVGYSGWSGSNYLRQPYNSDLDFGTGDFCIITWVNATAGLAAQAVIERGDDGVSPGNSEFAIAIGSDETPYLQTTSTGGTAHTTAASGIPMPTGVWSLLVGVRRSNQLEMWVNGELKSTADGASDNLTNTDAVTRLGSSNANGVPWLGSIALARISATAPSPEQIAKIYEDEKHLFTEGSQATLYGSSDAVTALAYDDSTELLHVGTSAGRSDFQGLRRVNNTTNAVGAAISASNGMIVEE